MVCGFQEIEQDVTGGKELSLFVENFLVEFDPVVHGPFSDRRSYGEQIIVVCRADEFGRPFDDGHDDAGGLDVLIAETELADGFDAAYLEILGVVSVIDHIHLVGLGITDADLRFAGEHNRLFPHGAVDAVFAGTCQEQGNEGGQEDEGYFAMFQRLSFQCQEGGDGKVDDQDQGSEAGKEPQREEAGANNFGEDAEHEGPPVADVKEVVKGKFIFAEVGDLSQAVVDEEQQAESHTKDEGAEVKGAVGALSGEEFFHVRFGIFAKILYWRYL